MGFRFDGCWLGRFPRQAGAILCMVLLALSGGCPNFSGGPTPTDNGNDNVPPDGDTTAEIITPSTGFGMSALDPPVSVLYSVDESATNVRGFYFPVADGSLDSAPIGERVITATDLEVGVRQVFSFDPEEAGVGFYRVGIIFTLNGAEDDISSRAVIQVQGSPDPTFIQPSPALTEVTQGADVFISFDVRDPEGNVQWRLFYLSETDSRDNPADLLGTGLATGSGNAGTFTLTTGSLEPGDYQLGISATDSGSSIAVTVANGESDRIVTIPNTTTTAPILRVIEASVPMPPTIAITAPGATNVSIQSNESFTIRFTGEIHEPGATGTIEVFYDTDNDVGNGFVTIAADLSVSTTSVLFPTGVPGGTYFIGATILDGINPAVTVYAAGKLIVTP
mgnify:CR=1 FL=1